jgi:hypothetical protein
VAGSSGSKPCFAGRTRRWARFHLRSSSRSRRTVG